MGVDGARFVRVDDTAKVWEVNRRRIVIRDDMERFESILEPELYVGDSWAACAMIFFFRFFFYFFYFFVAWFPSHLLCNEMPNSLLLNEER